MSPRSPFLFLSEADMIAAGVDDAARSVRVADEVFRLLHRGDYLMGGPRRNSHGLVVSFPKWSPFPNMPLDGPDRRFSAMPAYLGGRFDLCGVKWYGSNAENRSKGLPRSVLTVMLNDKETGEPLALLAAGRLSSSRTAAVPAVASRYLPRRRPRRVAVVGCGEINRQVVRALLSQHPDIETIVCHNRSREKAEPFAAQIVANGFSGTVEIADTPHECVRDADLVTVAASRTAPLRIEAASFSPEACILLSGPMQSDDALWTSSTVIWDHVPLHQDYIADARVSGDTAAGFAAQIGGPLYALADRGRIAAIDRGVDLGTVMVEQRSPAAGRTVFVSSGMAVFDVAWGADLLQSARALGIGTPLELWGTDAADETDPASVPAEAAR
ncbi:ornithine cyclodeaminase [Microbacterium sp. 1.5R]|uniref:ornithine cyclodeaminase n=1 Tax=Microbacterium sp. 1.5R TaxID=1916917 RepID=UPI0011A16F1D|nr:ornithine cyclodeaminase [Microbacterium sp. 1.5R]